MKRTVICGAGKMGLAIGSAMKKLGYSISIVENNEDNVKKYHLANGECQVYKHWNDVKPEADVVISSLPYMFNDGVAKWAIDHQLRYCDLGGSVTVSKSIKDMAKNAKAPVMTDLGLAPGWVNILGEEVWSQVPKTQTVTMMVGGIPQDKYPVDPFNYMMTWSVDGLMNEYMDDCEVLLDGRKVVAPGMTGLEDVTIDGMELEAFYTSGAAAHSIESMRAKGVQNCYYKTLRWRGHCKLVKCLLDNLDREIVGNLLSKTGKHHSYDIVVINASARGGHVKVDKTVKILRCPELTAMQKATAFPTAVVADLMASGHMDGLKYPSYESVDVYRFNETIDWLLSIW